MEIVINDTNILIDLYNAGLLAYCKKLNLDFPEHQFVLMMGSDNALVFDQWKKYNELLENYEILLYPRKGYDFEEVAHIYPQMKQLNTPYFEISSTEIRSCISQKKDITA